jgi:hypothetical protein
MFRVIGAFLLVFSLLSFVVRMDALAEVFGIVALLCIAAGFAADFLQQHRHVRPNARRFGRWKVV